MLNATDQTPKSAKLSKPPIRKKNLDSRSREYLSAHEVESLRKAAKSLGRNGVRDDTLILLMFRHALRVGEIIALRWDQVDMTSGFLHVNRLKNGVSSIHPLRGVELRALRELRRVSQKTPAGLTAYVFVSERQAPLTERTVHHIISRAGEEAKLGFSVHPHMLRHSTGFYLANKGTDTRAIQDYMGHANIKNTVIYTQLSPNRFNFWKD